MTRKNLLTISHKLRNPFFYGNPNQLASRKREYCNNISSARCCTKSDQTETHQELSPHLLRQWNGRWSISVRKWFTARCLPLKIFPHPFAMHLNELSGSFLRKSSRFLWGSIWFSFHHSDWRLVKRRSRYSSGTSLWTYARMSAVGVRIDFLSTSTKMRRDWSSWYIRYREILNTYPPVFHRLCC